MDTFDRLIDTDGVFFRECCEEGFKRAVKSYELNQNSRNHYGQAYHEQKLQLSYAMYLEYARGPHVTSFMEKLKEACDLIWMTNRQLCESLSLRGNPCVMPKPNHNALEHTSGAVFVSTCNCGRTQARREDPYLVKQANYDFYQLISCPHCVKTERISFPVFQPSINDYCAANISVSPDNFRAGFGGPLGDGEEEEEGEDGEETDPVDNNQNTTPLTQQSHSDLSYEEFLNRATPEEKRCRRPSSKAVAEEQKELVDEELNEIVVKVGELKVQDASMEEKFHYPDGGVSRQPSTTEYLPGMVTTNSPAGLLPQLPSWSLMCIGRSLIYSHNTGIQEHFQGKFLSGTNMLLPWNVHVRLEHSSNWTANYERSRKKQVSNNPNVFQLKIFIGMEYECPKGHRFIMSGPDKIVQSSDVNTAKNLGSKVAYNDMPLYYPCRCQAANPLVAQLMRVHIVTPKAPVNVIVEPKVRIGNRTTNPLIFTTGLAEPVKLSQSDYWMLRLPYVYQTEEAPILPPTQVDPNNAVIYGCLLAGMFGIVESEEELE